MSSWSATVSHVPRLLTALAFTACLPNYTFAADSGADEATSDGKAGPSDATTDAGRASEDADFVPAEAATMNDGPMTPDAPSGTDATAGPAVQFVNAVSPDFADGGVTGTMLVSAGRLLVAATYSNAGTEAEAVADTLGNTWTSAPEYNNTQPCFQGRGTQVQIWYAVAGASGSDQVTVSGADNHGLFLVEYEVPANTQFDTQSGQVATSPSNLATAGSLSLAGPYDLVVAVFEDTNGMGQMAPGQGFTRRGYDMTAYAIVVDNLPVGRVTGPVSATVSLPMGIADSCWAGAAVAFKMQ